MKYFILFALFAQSHFLQSQPIQWFDIHPTWHVLFTAGFAGAGAEIVTVDADTLLDGRTSTILNRNNFLYTHFSYVAQSGDSILLWMDSTFHLMYDFSKDSGFVFTMPRKYDNGDISFEVQSNSNIQLGTNTLRTQIWKQLDTPQDFFYEVVEGIGVSRTYSPNGYESAHHLFWNEPDNSAVDGEAWYLCRYRSDLGIFDPFPIMQPCTDYVSMAEISEKNQSFSVYPNPIHETLYLDLKNFEAEAQFTLRNSLGQSVFSLNAVQDLQEIQVGNLENGVYFYEIRTEKKALPQSGILIKK